MTMKNFLNYKVAAAADAVVNMLSAQMGPRPLTDRRIAVMRHTYEGGVLVQFQIHRLSDATTYDFGVRQAWLYVHPDVHRYELHFTHRDEIKALQEQYPELRSISSILFAQRPKGAPTHPLEDILLVCEFIRDFFVGDLDEIPTQPQRAELSPSEAELFQDVGDAEPLKPVLGYKVMGAVQTLADLPKEGQEIGDLWLVEKGTSRGERCACRWNGVCWQEMAPNISSAWFGLTDGVEGRNGPPGQE